MRDWKPEDDEPEDRMETGDAVIVIVIVLTAALLVGYGALYITGVITGRQTYHYEGGGSDYDAAQFPEEFEPTEESDQ
ncbi:MAG: hypothetical protein ACLFRG_22135 [Desulfococcaceae bacterium]